MALQKQKDIQTGAGDGRRGVAAREAAASSALSAAGPTKGAVKVHGSLPGWTYRTIRNGVPATEVKALEKAHIVERDDIRMIIPDRTLERRIRAHEPLKTEEADGIARLLRVVKHAREVFDDDGLADRWLRLPNPALNGEIPIRMAATDLGAREVEAVLTRIEHGVFS